MISFFFQYVKDFEFTVSEELMECQDDIDRCFATEEHTIVFERFSSLMLNVDPKELDRARVHRLNVEQYYDKPYPIDDLSVFVQYHHHTENKNSKLSRKNHFSYSSNFQCFENSIITFISFDFINKQPK